MAVTETGLVWLLLRLKYVFYCRCVVGVLLPLHKVSVKTICRQFTILV